MSELDCDMCFWSDFGRDACYLRLKGKPCDFGKDGERVVAKNATGEEGK